MAEKMNVMEGAKYMHDVVLPLAEEVRGYADAIEPMVDKNYWPMPTYEDILFY